MWTHTSGNSRPWHPHTRLVLAYVVQRLLSGAKTTLASKSHPFLNKIHIPGTNPLQNIITKLHPHAIFPPKDMWVMSRTLGKIIFLHICIHNHYVSLNVGRPALVWTTCSSPWRGFIINEVLQLMNGHLHVHVVFFVILQKPLPAILKPRAPSLHPPKQSWTQLST